MIVECCAQQLVCVFAWSSAIYMTNCSGLTFSHLYMFVFAHHCNFCFWFVYSTCWSVFWSSSRRKPSIFIYIIQTDLTRRWSVELCTIWSRYHLFLKPKIMWQMGDIVGVEMLVTTNVFSLLFCFFGKSRVGLLKLLSESNLDTFNHLTLSGMWQRDLIIPRRC